MLSKNLFTAIVGVAATFIGSINATPTALEGRVYCPADVDLPVDASCPLLRPPRCDIEEFSICPGCCPPCPPQLVLPPGVCPFVRPKECDRKIWSHCPACCNPVKS